MAIRDKLVFLYGEQEATAFERRLDEMLRKYSKRFGKIRRKATTPLSERDTILITYPDQVREAGVLPLQTLTNTLNTHLTHIVSGVHLLPFYPSSSDDGFAVTDYLSVDPGLGTWDDVARVGQHFDLMFDLVINHVSAQSEWFRRFLQDDPAYRDYFIVVEGDPDLSRVVRPRTLPMLTKFQTPSGEKKVWTTFSADQIDLNYRNPDVLLAMLDVLLFYVARGARFIRLDAIAYLWKEIGTPCIHLPQAHAIVQLMRAVLDEVAPWVMLITETNVPHAENISYFGDGTNEAQLVYNFALPPLVLHTFNASDATQLSRWAQMLTLPSNRVTLFNFLASHDGIGLTPVSGLLSFAEIDALITQARAHGGFVSYKQNADGTTSPYELNINYFDALSNPNDSEPVTIQVNRFIASQAIMLSLAGVPGIYFHSIFGSRGDRASAETFGIPRRINRQKLTRDELERDLANPDSLRAQVFSRYAELLRVRRAHRAFHPNGLQHVVPCNEHVFAVLRVAPDADERVLCLHNVAEATETVRLARNHSDERWKDLFTGKVYGADADDVFVFELQPYQVLWALQGNETNSFHATGAISRVTRSKEQARSAYDKLSRWYDWLAGNSEKEFVNAGLGKLKAQSGERVLEIGFGTGYAIVELARAVGESGKVYGIDLSEGMFNIAQARVSKAGLADRVELRRGDATHMSFDPESLDAIFMSFTLELFDTPEIPTVLQECKRVLRNGGHTGVVAMAQQSKPGFATRLYEWTHAKFPSLADCRPIFLQQAVEQAGFRVAKVTEMSMWQLPVEIVVAEKR